MARIGVGAAREAAQRHRVQRRGQRRRHRQRCQPTQGRSSQEIDEALDELEGLIIQAPHSDWICVAGDFNFTGSTWLAGNTFGSH